MNYQQSENIMAHQTTINGKHHKPILIDYRLPKTDEALPLVIFVHGFKGFKDFGAFDLIADQFANAGFAYVKFNFSHNGTTPQHPIDFVDLKAFGENNFSKELDDLGDVMDWLMHLKENNKVNIDVTKVYLIGHSRGGGIALLKGGEDSRVQKICTWAAVSDFGEKWNSAVQKHWKEAGVIQIINGRTKQEMPLNWQLCDDYFNNLDRLSIPVVAKQLQQEVLLIHGTSDEAVPFTSAEQLHRWIKRSELYTIQNGNHVFDTKHPYNEKKLPEHMQMVVDKTIEFFKHK